MGVPRDDENVKSILVSGGAGYLGSTMVPLFLKEGYKVTVYDIFRWGSAPLFAILHDPNLTVIKGMLTWKSRNGRKSVGPAETCSIFAYGNISS